MLKNSEGELGKSCINSLQMADTAIKQLKDSLYKDCVNLSLNKSVINMGSYLKTPYFMEPNEIVNLMQIFDLLNNLARTNDIYHSIYLYLDNYPYIITSSSDLVDISNFEDKDWIKYLDQYNKEKYPLSFIDTRQVTTNDGDEFMTTYIYPFNPYTSSLNGAVIINIREGAINEMINSNAGGSGGSVFIINKLGNVVSNGDTSMLCKNISGESYVKQILDNKASSGYFFDVEDSTRLLISFYKSDFNDWIYVGKFPISILTENQNRIRNKSLVLALLVMILGISTAFFASKRIYRPLDGVVKTIKSEKWLALQNDEDEMSVLYKVLNTIKENAEGLSIEENIKKDRRNVIRKLLSGDALDDKEEATLKNACPHDYYLCIVIEIDKYNAMSLNYEEEQWRYIKSLLLELSEEVFAQDYKCIACAVKKGETAVVLNMDEENTERYISGIYEKITLIKNESAKVLDNTLTVGIGAVHCGINGMWDSYLEAQTALRQKMRLGFDQIIVWNTEFANNAYYYPLKTEEHISNCIETCQKDKIIAEVLKLIAELKEKPNLSCENINQIVTQLVGNTIIKYTIEHSININEVYGVNFNIYAELSYEETLDDIQNFLIKNYSILLDYISSQKDQRKIVQKIIEYINCNYKKDIGISDVADAVGLSYSHVRRIFKEEMGVNITDYINDMRIKEAKLLLLDKQLSVKSIAEMIGYNSDQSFERYFKKIMGITPTEFRVSKLN